jgi:hypothetical protein
MNNGMGYGRLKPRHVQQHNSFKLVATAFFFSSRRTLYWYIEDRHKYKAHDTVIFGSFLPCTLKV